TSRYTIDTITVHPSYDPVTKANNVALVQYNKGSTVTWFNYNAIKPTNWTGIIYAQRYLSDVNGMAWATPKVYTQSNTGDSTLCPQLSPLYKANEGSMACSSGVSTSPSASLSSCSVPYQVAYAFFSNTATYVYQAGFFSHAVVESGTDMCKYGQQRSYYTLISDYLEFAVATLGRTVYYYNPNNATMPQTNLGFTMTLPTSAAPAGANMLSGDFYANQTTTPSQTSSSSSRTISSPTSSATNTSSSDNSDSGNSDGGGGMSKRTIAIVAACSAVGSVLLLTGSFFLVRWWRGHLKRTRDPYKETAAQEILANDLGGATIPGEYNNGGGGSTPPPYIDTESPRSRASAIVSVVMEMPSPHSMNNDEYPSE
ncbi:hypothetical protein GGI21_006266, partial [Coemansia aciculifera]